MDSYESYIKAWKARLNEEEIGRQAKTKRALADAERLARVLLRDYGVRAVYLFGSLAQGAFREGSDIDLAVDGLDPARYFHALGAIDRLTEFEIDLVRIEEASDALREAIEREGRSLL